MKSYCPLFYGTILPLVAMVLQLGACCTTPKAASRIEAVGNPYTYVTNNGEEIVATYYHLSDESLSFVKVVLPDGKEYTLPQAVSASGARYTDAMSLVWWSKGDTARVEIMGDDGEWVALYEECRVQPNTP